MSLASILKAKLFPYLDDSNNKSEPSEDKVQVENMNASSDSNSNLSAKSDSNAKSLLPENNRLLTHDDFLLHLKNLSSQDSQINELKSFISNFEAKRKSAPRQAEADEIQNDIYIESLKEIQKLPLKSGDCSNSRSLLISQFNQKEEIGSDVTALNMALEIFDQICPTLKK